MSLHSDLTGADEAALVVALGALPDAPLAMPKQRLEHRRGRWGRFGLLSRLMRGRLSGGARLGRSGS